MNQSQCQLNSILYSIEDTGNKLCIGYKSQTETITEVSKRSFLYQLVSYFDAFIKYKCFVGWTFEYNFQAKELVPNIWTI